MLVGMSFVDCVILSSRELTEVHSDDLELTRALQAQDIRSQIVAWEDFNPQSNDCGFILFRTTWGYYKNLAQFRELLSGLNELSIPTWNPPDLIRWNLHKRYLLNLEKRGVGIVPTLMRERGSDLKLIEAAETLDSDLLVIKPAIGASAYHTHLVDLARIKGLSPEDELIKISKSHDLMIQAFVPEVQSEGEYSLIFIETQLTHCVLKKPDDQDFRVEPSKAQKISCPPQALSAAQRALRAVESDYLYARVDLVHSEGRFLVMELELIEPELFLRLEPRAAELLASSISKRL